MNNDIEFSWATAIVKKSDVFLAIQTSYRPEEVFCVEELEEWALKNGFIKKPRLKK